MQQASDPNLKARIAGELGVAYCQAHRCEQAEPLLKLAYQSATGSGKLPNGSQLAQAVLSA